MKNEPVTMSNNFENPIFLIACILNRLYIDFIRTDTFTGLIDYYLRADVHFTIDCFKIFVV